MVTFFIRRFLTSVLVVLISTFIMYLLVAASIDPLQDLQTSKSPNKAQLIHNRIVELDLDQSGDPPVLQLAQGRRGLRASASATWAATGASTSPSPASSRAPSSPHSSW